MDLKEIVKESHSCSEVARKIGYKYTNGMIIKKVRNLIKNENCDYSHFIKNGKQKVYERIERRCLVCNKKFTVKKDHPRAKRTCSRSCSNVYFRSGTDNGNWKDEVYRTTCFLYHKKECVCCDEKNVIDVHHLDGDNTNSKPENLIPLCPTHHRYWHSKYRNMVKQQILNYIENWKLCHKK